MQQFSLPPKQQPQSRAGRTKYAQCFSAANSLGYIQMKPDTLIDINDIDHYKNNQLVILTTGSQAEPMSALSRMAFASHRSVDIHPGDTVVLSANLIPERETDLSTDQRIVSPWCPCHIRIAREVHVSGHAYRKN